MFDVLGNSSAVSPFTVTPEIAGLILDSKLSRMTNCLTDSSGITL